MDYGIDQPSAADLCENNVVRTGNDLMADWYSSYLRANIIYDLVLMKLQITGTL